MINSVVDLCNMALSRLGEERITALPPGDDSEAAKECQLHYAQTRDEVLEDHPWRCAVHYQSLAQVADTDPGYLPQVDYEYQYSLPADPYCLLPLLESTKDEGGNDINCEIAGRFLLTDSDTVILKYVKRIVNVPELDPQLGESIALRMATKMCMKLTNNRALRSDLLGEWVGIMTRARMNDASAVKSEELVNPKTLISEIT
jgi:hypothetical protein